MGKVSPKIFGAIVVGFVMIATALFLSLTKAPVSSAAESEGASSEKKSLRTFIPVTDNDNNSVPDWQESFAGLEINKDELSANSLYSPNTTTGELAADLGLLLTASDKQAEVAYENQKLVSEQMIDRAFTRDDIYIINDDSLIAKKYYGNRVAEIAMFNSVVGGNENEIIILRRSLNTDKPEILQDLDPIIESYEGIIYDMLSEPVPNSLVKEHLSLLNVYQALLNDIKAFRNVFEDALPSMLRLQRYPSDTEALYAAISNLYLRLHKEGIVWTENDSASKLIKIENTENDYDE